jgi:hypothetical protein
MYYFAGHKDAYFIMANKKSSRLQDMEIQNNIKKKKKKMKVNRSNLSTNVTSVEAYVLYKGQKNCSIQACKVRTK